MLIIVENLNQVNCGFTNIALGGGAGGGGGHLLLIHFCPYLHKYYYNLFEAMHHLGLNDLK